MPSSALSTEIEGVITPSPYRRAAPNRPAAVSRVARLQACAPNRAPISDSSARMPPSPLLSARITRAAYLNVTMNSTAQISSEALAVAVAASILPPAAETTVCMV